VVNEGKEGLTMGQRGQRVKVEHCQRCDSEWVRRPVKGTDGDMPPKVCAICKSPYWNKGRKLFGPNTNAPKMHDARAVFQKGVVEGQQIEGGPKL